MEVILHLSLDIEEKLSRTLFEDYKDFKFLSNLRECFLEEGWGDLKLEFLGVLAISIYFARKEEVDKFIVSNKDVSRCWFEFLGKWNPCVYLSTRLAVVSISGLPFCSKARRLSLRCVVIGARFSTNYLKELGQDPSRNESFLP